MARTLLTILGVLLLAGLALLAWPQAAERPAEGAAGPEHRADTAGAGAAARAPEEVERVDAGPEAVTASPSIVLRVVHRGEPVALAEVMFAADGGDDFEAAEQMARTSGRTERSGPDGRVRLPRPGAEGYRVFGRLDDLWGETRVSRQSADDLELRLEPDRTVRARLRDETLVPVAGAELALAAAHWEGRFVSAMRRNTGADGVATFTHVQSRLWRDRDEHQAIVGLDFPLHEPVRAPVDLQAIPREPIELRLPATGTVVLEFVDDDGPFTPAEEIEVRIGAEIAASGLCAHSPCERHIETSTMLLPYVALGLRLRVVIESNICTADVELPGPTSAGEEVRARVPVHRQPALSGRLVRPDGTPVSGIWDANYPATEKFTNYHVYFSSKADGRFRMPLPPAFGDSKHTTFVIEPMSKASAEERLQARVDLPRRLLQQQGGEHDLGDVVIGPMPLLAAGIVVDGTGRPVAGAEVHVRHVEENMIRVSGLSTEPITAADGTFVVRGNVPALGLHLAVRKADHESAQVAFQAGAVDLRIVVNALGMIEGRVLLDEGIRPQDVMVTWEEHGARKLSTVGGHMVLKGDQLRLQRVHPGPVTVSFHAVGSPEPLIVLPDALVREGDPTRLAEVDLRGRLRRLTVSIRDEDGAPVPTAFVLVNPSAGSGEREALRTTLGILHLLVQTPAVDLAVHAPGYRHEVVRGVQESAAVVLRRGIRIRIDAGGVAVPALPTELIAVLVPEQAAPEAREHGRMTDYRDAYEVVRGDAMGLGVERAPVDRSGLAVVSVPAAASYRVTWRVRRDDEEFIVADPQAPVIAVKEGGQQTFRATVPATALAAAVRRLPP